MGIKYFIKLKIKIKNNGVILSLVILNNHMKKITYLALVLLIIPSIACASWWNPISWFNGWSFFGKTEVLEKRIQDLEEKLSDKQKIEELEKKLSEKQKVENIKPSTPSLVPVKSNPVVKQIDPKIAQFISFKKFMDDFNTIKGKSESSFDFFDEGMIASADQNYFKAMQDLKKAKDIFQTTINSLNNLEIPAVPFSDGIRQLIQLQISYYNSGISLYDKHITLNQTLYSNNVTSDPLSELGNLRLVNATIPTLTQEMKNNTNFAKEYITPKIAEVIQKSNAYFK